MNGKTENAVEERRKYVSAFNATMVKIWRERMVKLDVFSTGNLYRSTDNVELTIADDKILDVTLRQSFNTYGLFVDWGTGRNTPRGNSGDIGRDNKRKPKRWFSRKYYASVMNLQEFYADSVGKEFCLAVANALDRATMRKSITL